MMMTTQNKDKKFAVHLRFMNLNVTIMATLLLFIVFLGATSYLYMQSSSTIHNRKDLINTYGQALEKSFQQESTQQEWKRLHKYHGNPAVVIYEEGKTPYFYDKQGNKCAFIRQSKRTGPVRHPQENNEYSTSLMLDQKLVME